MHAPSRLRGLQVAALDAPGANPIGVIGVFVALFGPERGQYVFHWSDT